MSFGLALAGGGARGAAHVGVLLALEEAGLYPSSIAGSSAGGIVAGLYASGMPAKEIKRITLELSKDNRFFIDVDYKGLAAAIGQLITRRDISFSGFLKGDNMEQYFCYLTGKKNMKDCVLKTVIPAVDLNSGQTIAFINSLDGVKKLARVQWRTDAPLCTAMRASAAVPVVFRPKKLGQFFLVDGGVTDALPVNLLRAAGEENILAVDITEAYETPNGSSVFDIATHSFSIMRLCLLDHISRGEKLLLKPALPDAAGLLTFHQMPECMEIGYNTTVKAIPIIKSIFSN